MSKDILVGFNIHPRWIDGTSLHDFISPLRPVRVECA